MTANGSLWLTVTIRDWVIKKSINYDQVVNKEITMIFVLQFLVLNKLSAHFF